MAIKFEEAANKILDFAGDMSSISVNVMSGKAYVTDGDSKTLDFDKMFTQIASSDENDVELKLATHIDIDGDTNVFIASGEIDPMIIEAHKTSVEAAKEIRGDILRSIIELVKQ